MAPHAAYFPDLLTPPEDLCGIDQSIDALLSTEPDRLRAEIDLIHPASGPEASWLDDLTRGRSPTLRQLRDGPEGLLDALGPATRWDLPVLSVDYPVDRDLHLDGRGLVLIPCYFALHHPVALADPRLPPALAFPIRTESRLLAAGAPAATT